MLAPRTPAAGQPPGNLLSLAETGVVGQISLSAEINTTSMMIDARIIDPKAEESRGPTVLPLLVFPLSRRRIDPAVSGTMYEPA